MIYADASVILRLLFNESGPRLTPREGQRLVSSRMVEVEAFRAVDRARLIGLLDDVETARKRKELTDVLATMDLVPVDDGVIERARDPFAVNVSALDAIHVATAIILAAEAGEAVEFWTHDTSQANAALSRGLEVLGIEA